MLGRSLWKRYFSTGFTKINIAEVTSNPRGFVEEAIAKNKAVLFMKGSPEEPLCGFSRYVAQALKHYGVKDFHYVNILENAVVREEVKRFSDWPTYPQLYLNKEFIGGHDILSEMHKNNTLEALLEKHGVKA